MTPYYQSPYATLYAGDCLDVLPSIPDASVDAIISDPPYPMIKREYGMMTETAWMDMMQEVVRQSRRILKPTGSAVFILQPNSEKVGKMRPWLWQFMAWCCEEWNVIQDVYWWNYTAMPTGVSTPRSRGLTRASVKPCVWLGEPECHRNQNAVLLSESDHLKTDRLSAKRGRHNHPSGQGRDEYNILKTALERGGTTPFNLLPIPNANPYSSAGAHGHGAGTPQEICDWWTRYIVPAGGVVLDMFAGTATTGITSIEHGATYIGIERFSRYLPIAAERLSNAKTPLFTHQPAPMVDVDPEQLPLAV